MDILRLCRRLFLSMLLLSLCGFLSGCQIGYVLKSAGGELEILHQRVPIDDALKDPKISDADKAKIRLAQEARVFAQTDLGLVENKNYTTYVGLDRPYVTYVVSAASQWELTGYTWWFPFTGSVPYKGYFKEQEAKDEEESLQHKNLDTYMRGVSAFSTLGWFRDPLLSSMLRYSDQDLVNTIIHETVHATLYIKSSADFNERMAVFLGNLGAEKFYLKKEGPQSKTAQQIKLENEDERLFSTFISAEIRDLETWYKDEREKNGGKPIDPTKDANKAADEERRQAQFLLIQEHFKVSLAPKLKTDNYSHFPSIKLNNARLLLYKTYVGDLSDFAELYKLTGENVALFLEKCKSLKDNSKPEDGLRELIRQMKENSLSLRK
jgi:predicted aminopeptidase